MFAALQVPVDAVGVKLGPKSKFALIGKKWGRPLVCDDRVTIAKEVEIKDPKKTSAPDAARSGRSDLTSTASRVTC